MPQWCPLGRADFSAAERSAVRLRMLQEGEWTKASIYVGASVLGGLMAMILGMHVGDAL
jgi:fluoride ion exporter CrcB/FEX